MRPEAIASFVFVDLNNVAYIPETCFIESGLMKLLIAPLITKFYCEPRTIRHFFSVNILQSKAFPPF